MQTNPISALILELDLPGWKPIKPLKGCVVRSNSPTTTQRRKWRRMESYKHIDLENLETLICVRSKTPMVLDTTPRLRRTNRSSPGITHMRRDSSLKALPERKYTYAKRTQRNPILAYDPVREVHYYISPNEHKEQAKTSFRAHKPLGSAASKLRRKATPLGRNNIYFKTQDVRSARSFAELRPTVSKSRLFKLF